MTTGSSIMPQKRNPDVFELVRGRTATAQACLVEALAITAKLPSGYHRDLQLLKAPLFRGIDLASETLAIIAAALPECASTPSASASTPASTPPRRRTGWCWRRGFPSARRIGGWGRGTGRR